MTPSAPRPGPQLPMTAFARSRWAYLLYALMRLLDKLTFGKVRLVIYLICAQPLDANKWTSVRDDANTAIWPVSPESELVALFPRPPKVIHERFKSGAVCHVATVKDQFAGYIWLAQHHYDEDEVRCRFLLPKSGDCVWDFDVYVDPKFRHGRTMSRLWKSVEAFEAARGNRWSYSRISLFNIRSIQSHERIGARYVTTAAFLSAGPVQLAAFTRWPFLHLSIGRSFPTLEMPSPVSPVDMFGH